MNVTLIDREPTPVVYLRYTGPYGEPLTRFWQRTVFPWLAQNGLQEQPCFGISHDNPSMTEPEQCRYDACAEIPPDFTSPENTLTTTIPGGRYAVVHFSGTAHEIGAAWLWLFQEWLPASGFQLDARPCFEYYPKYSGPDPQTGVFDCDICIPIAPL